MFEKLWKKVLRRKPLSILAVPCALLWVLSLFYRLGLAIRAMTSKPGLKLSTPVIGVGNITVGGTGKTPIVELLARYLEADGYRVGIASSGYSRGSKEAIVAEGYKLQSRDVEAISDEVMYLANELPNAHFAINEVKAEAARLLSESGKVDLIIVDDAFQHQRLQRDIDIVAFDSTIPDQQLKLFPCGVLREPISGLSKADIIIATRSNLARDPAAIAARLKSLAPEAEQYQANFWIDELITKDQRLPVKYLEDKSVFLFAGVGNFRTLRKQTDALAGDLDYALELSDHQAYTPETLEKIKNLADQYDSDIILTTGKDWVKIVDFDFGRETCYLSQVVDLDPGEEKLLESLKTRLNLSGPGG